MSETAKNTHELLSNGPLRSFIELIIGGVIVVIIMFIKKGISSMLEKANFTANLQNNTQIVANLAGLRGKVGADRAAVFLFHNGSYYSNGSAILRMTCVSEDVSPGTSMEMQSSKDILISTVPEATAYIVNFDRNNPVPFKSDVQTYNDCYYKTILKSQGVHSLMKYPLYRGSYVIGFISVHFNAVNRTPTASDLTELKEASHVIEHTVNESARMFNRGAILKVLKGLFRQ